MLLRHLQYILKVTEQDFSQGRLQEVLIMTYPLKYENLKMGAGDINAINVVIVSKEKH